MAGFEYDVAWRTEVVRGRSYDLLVLRDLEASADALWEHVRGVPGATERYEALIPLFGWLWPSARVLAESVGVAPGARVLELGCGLALPSLVCAAAGAEVLATDAHPDVPAFLAENLARNGLSVEFRALDWRGADLAGTFDHVLASDVLYERALPELAAAVFARHLAPGGTGWLADPGRPWLEEFEAAARRRGLSVAMDVHRVGGDEAFLLKLTSG